MTAHCTKSIVCVAALLALCFTSAVRGADDPLPSWNDGPAKQAIVDFVKATTDSASPKFVPPEERIATFDQDGTLWVEHPVYSFVMYALDRVPARGQGKTASCQGRTVQDRYERRPRSDRKALAAGP